MLPYRHPALRRAQPQPQATAVAPLQLLLLPPASYLQRLLY